MSKTGKFNPNRLTTRDDLIQLLDSAMYVGSTRYARQIILTWLAYYPGDLEIRFRYCQLLINSGQADQAIKYLTELCTADPEYLAVWQLLSTVQQKKLKGSISSDSGFFLADCQAAIHALGASAKSPTPLPTWAENIRKVRQALKAGDVGLAEEMLHPMLVVDPLPPLIAVSHLQVLRVSSLASQAVQNLAEFYHQRFPTAIAPIFHLAESLMDGGEPEKGVAYLHKGATLDITGQVSDRLWGPDHAYKNIWPDRLEAPIEVPIPADVAALFGWNQLPHHTTQETDLKHNEPVIEAMEDGEAIRYLKQLTVPLAVSEVNNADIPEKPVQPSLPSEYPSQTENNSPESLLSIQAELDQIAARINKNQLQDKDGRFPIYLLFTTRQGLEKKYTPDEIRNIDHEMCQVAAQIGKRRNWGAKVIYADDEKCMSEFGLASSQAEDPWSLKLALIDIDKVLGKKGQMIGAVLIVGGPQVVPYHKLPNPVDDFDFEVASDNPYSTRDENYFIPEWPIGRLPDGNENDASALIELLHRISAYHVQLNKDRNWFQVLIDRIRRYLSFSTNGKKKSWGYTAAIWRRASLSVFRPIGDPHTMYVSPPVQIDINGNGSSGNSTFPLAKMGYFNLHGLEDSGFWYGQRDPSEPGQLPDYPIALRPEDIADPAPQVVFTEACYGAHIDGKNQDEALALKFLSTGSSTFTGSTCTSYGSITTPLIAADLLGHAFWKYLREGIPAGEALRRAKIHLAKTMHDRQGYLDGEDQKTLISFLLFGDPLAQLSMSSREKSNVYRTRSVPNLVTTVCDRDGNCYETQDEGLPLQENPPLPGKTLEQVKLIVEQYLPGMSDAKVKFSRTHTTNSGTGSSSNGSYNTSKSKMGSVVGRNVVTLSKHVKKSSSQDNEGCIHHHYARLTVDENGKLLKLAVSR